MPKSKQKNNLDDDSDFGFDDSDPDMGFSDDDDFEDDYDSKPEHKSSSAKNKQTYEVEYFEDPKSSLLVFHNDIAPIRMTVDTFYNDQGVKNNLLYALVALCQPRIQVLAYKYPNGVIQRIYVAKTDKGQKKEYANGSLISLMMKNLLQGYINEHVTKKFSGMALEMSGCIKNEEKWNKLVQQCFDLLEELVEVKTKEENTSVGQKRTREAYEQKEQKSTGGSTKSKSTKKPKTDYPVERVYEFVDRSIVFTGNSDDKISTSALHAKFESLFDKKKGEEVPYERSPFSKMVHAYIKQKYQSRVGQNDKFKFKTSGIMYFKFFKFV